MDQVCLIRLFFFFIMIFGCILIYFLRRRRKNKRKPPAVTYYTDWIFTTESTMYCSLRMFNLCLGKQPHSI